MAKAPKAPGAPAESASADLSPFEVRVHNPGVYLAGSLTGLVKAGSGDGAHEGWTITEDALGIILSKAGQKTKRLPWGSVKEVEYSEAE